jgi:thiol-disulfide isomerase/thioredoxin
MTNAKKSKQRRQAPQQKRPAQSQRKAPPPRSKGGKSGKGKGGRGGSSNGLWIALGVGLVAIVILAVAFTGSSGSGPSPAGSVTIAREPGPQLQPGEPIPEWSAPSLDGDGNVAWSDYVGSPTVFAIWAPWCQHCQAELPRLSAAVEQRPAVELVTVTTAVDRGGPAPQEYMDSRNLSFPVGVDDAAGTISSGVGVQAFPTTYYVDSNGNVVQITEGEVDEAQLGAILDQLAQT